MEQTKWIWYKNDFELFHSHKLHARRSERGVIFPVQWCIPEVYSNVMFRKEGVWEQPETICVTINGIGHVRVNGKLFPAGKPVEVPAGNYTVVVSVNNLYGLPCAYIDSYESGKKNVTRHANIFTLLFGYGTQTQRELIVQNVILNDDVPQISTPYFKFYELESMCAIGKYEYVLEEIKDYGGAMVEIGATTFWEEFTPNVDRKAESGNRYREEHRGNEAN